eukprot:TRINITY_DN11553_c0_g1_i8.p1 TRINITY_DN11553_c0_g1~~TRINITY_DN11553_c0_g1_i8.p1  ORF type:complete len:292 (-),score=107.73 TRINITY_DN11553_c0_g1_i8:34-825(-)
MEVDGDEDDELLRDSDIDFSSLTRHREVRSKADYDRIKTEYNDQIGQMQQQLEQLNPNLKAYDKFSDAQDRIKSANQTFEDCQKEAKAAADELNDIKLQRKELFERAFNHVSQRIDGIYKKLTRDREEMGGGTAYLTLENSEEPYLDGVKYSAIPLNKRYRDMEQLSGGEKSVASLALLFALHSYRPAPFFVLDEVDAALDGVNVNRVSNYIRDRSHQESLQCVVISLKDAFYEKADGLVGVYRDRAGASSGTLTLDLAQYGS